MTHVARVRGCLHLVLAGALLVACSRGDSAARSRGGSVLAALATAPALSGVASPHAIAASAGQTYNVLDYGAAGDGKTSDTAAIQAAVTAACNGGGGTVWLPPGTYLTDGQIVVRSGPSTPCANVTIAGAGLTSVLAPANLAGGALVLSNSSWCTVRDLKIAGTFAQGVFIYQGAYNRVENLDIGGATLAAPAGSAGVELQDASDVSIERVVAHDNGGVVQVIQKPDGTMADVGDRGADIGSSPASAGNFRITVRNCRATSTQVSQNIGLYNTAQSLVASNYVGGASMNNDSSGPNGRSTTTGGYGIMFYRTLGATVAGQDRVVDNEVHGTSGTGIYMQCQPGSNVTGNRVDGAASAQQPASLQVAGISVGACYVPNSTIAQPSSVTVSGNSVTASAQAGISAGGLYNTIVDNKIGVATDAGIMLRDFHLGTVANNVITGCGGGIVTWGARSYSPDDVVDNIALTGNVIQGTAVFNKVAQPGIWLFGASKVTVAGGTISATQGPPITVEGGASNVNISGVGLFDGGQWLDDAFDGVAIINSSFVLVNGNQIVGSHLRFAVAATGSSDYVTATNNQLWATHDRYSLAGSSSKHD